MFFFFNDTATTEIYTLSLHDALPISSSARGRPTPEPLALGARGVPRNDRPDPHHPGFRRDRPPPCVRTVAVAGTQDRKSTRLNSSHANISYAVFCLKKKK